MSNVTLLAAAVKSDPTDATAALVYADAVQESGDERAAALIRANAELIRANAERVAAHAAALASADPVVRANAMLDGVRRMKKDGRRYWVTREVSDAKSSALRSAVARLAGATNRRGNALSCVSFSVVAGDAAPTYEGESWHYETTTGVLVRHPNAYKRVAKSAELVYCPASHVVTVGADWLIAHAAELTA